MQTLKKFIKYYKPYKAVFFIDLLCATIISAIDLAFPQLLRTLTKTLFAGAPGKIISALIPITIGLLVAYIIQTACRYYVTYAGHMMGARMERDMRKELFDQYEKLSFSYYDQNTELFGKKGGDRHVKQMFDGILKKAEAMKGKRLMDNKIAFKFLYVPTNTILYIGYKDNRFVHFSVYDKPYACGSYAYSCGAYACIFIWPE